MILCIAIGSFLCSTLLAQAAEDKLHGQTRAIIDDALPSITRIAALRTELFHEEGILERGAHAAPPEKARLAADLATARAAVQKEMAAYQAIPALNGERLLTIGLRDHVEEADHVIAATLAQPPEAVEGSEAPAASIAAVEVAQASALQLLEQEAAKASALTRAIEAAHSATVGASIVLDALSAFLAVILAAMSWRAVRYYIDRQEARAAELDLFAGRVAHDITSPLSALGVALALMKRGLPVEVLVPRAQASLGRVDAIIEGLLGFARSSHSPVEPGAHCMVGGVLEGVIADASERASQRGVTLYLDVARDLSVACHPGVLASIAGNLVGNAVKYIIAGSGPRRVAVRAFSRAARVRVEVEDTGPGIPRDIQGRIFEPFVRGGGAVEPGMGLGLATARRLCQAHGGCIGVNSAPGRGSTFWFELPSAPAPVAPIQRHPDRLDIH